ncbi:MAG: ATP synthase F0 subunit C [Deltaproteobacteria bacterium]|nr:ATP synthase F0 subunit C [Deltaproteobacteria bacterium]
MSKLNRISAFIVAAIVLAPAIAMAAEHDGGASSQGWIAIAAALTMGIAAAAGTYSQSRAATAALEGMARNPSASGDIRGSMILGLALIESLVLFAFVIAFLLQGKI